MSKGFSPKDFLKEEVLKHLDEKEAIFKIATSFSSDERKHYSAMLATLRSMHSKNSKATNAQKGKALEDLVSFLLKCSAIFDVYENIHTSSNEIDHLIKLNYKGNKFKNEGYIKFNNDIILSECKNYNKTVGVSWVGKFSSLMNYVETNIGLLFSYHGLSGSGWNDAIGLTKKFYLGSEKNNRIFILPFDKNDFQRIEEGENLLSLIDAKMFALRTDTNFSIHISKHPGQPEGLHKR